MLIEKRNFLGGINSDLSPRLLGDGEMLNLMNGRVAVTEFGRSNRIENIPGTTAISQQVFPPYGTSLTIGAISDNDRSRIIFFNYNTSDDHGIYCLDYSTPSTPVVYAVLYDSQVIGGLGFSKSYRIDRNAGIDGDLLYWTDNNNIVRRINIEAGIKMNHASYSTTVAAYSYPMNESVIALIRRPFGLGLTATKATDGSVTENFLKDFAGQFASAFVYRDGEETVFSLPSAMLNYNYATGTFNCIDVVFNINEDIDQDVQKVQLAVRYENDPSLFIIRTWDKDVAADLAEIQAHNAGSTALTYRFYNDRLGVAVGNARSVKPEDTVPLTAKTLSTAVNRLFLANYTKGYDAPAPSSIYVDLINSSSTDSTNAQVFKAYSTYQLALRFRDYYGRKSEIATNDDAILRIADRDYDGLPYIPSFQWAVSSLTPTVEIPDWAEYYDIMITKNLRTRYFIQWKASYMQYAIKNTDGTLTYQATYTGDAYGIAFDASLLQTGYLFNDGDLCRMYVSGSATVNETRVLGQDGNYIIVGLANLGNFTTIPNVIVEIYTPYKKSENETFYTTGQTYTVSNPGTESRQYSTLTGTINGDCYTEKITRTIFGSSYSWRVESMSPNNDVNSLAWFNIYGQPGISTGLGQSVKTNFVCWSNARIQGAQSNGLSSFDSLDEKALPQSMGDIAKIQVANKVTEEGNIMLAIGEKETASLYLGEVQLVGASANAFVATAPGVIGTVNVLRGSYGTVNPESVIEYLGLVFWLDALNGCFVQYSGAGLEPVSRYKMSRFFQRYSSNYLAANDNNLDNINGFHHIPTGIDPFHKEVICTLPGLIYSNYANTLPSYSSVPDYASSIIDRFDIYDQLAKSMAFCYEENKWGSNYEYMGEMYAYLQNTMFSFKNGAPYTHNTNTSAYNTFYGTEYPMRVCFTGNLNPSMLKDLFNISIEGNTEKPGFTVAMTTIPNQQITDLAYISASDIDDWTDDEGVLYSYFLKDRLSPNASGTADQKLYTGDFLKDFAIFVMCEWQKYDELMYVNFVNIGYEASKGQKNLTSVINP